MSPLAASPPAAQAERLAVAVRLNGVTRRFGPITALDGIDLDIEEGEFFAMLGPSGSGKTTCLRLIAGFDQPTSGHIEIFGETAEGLPPYRRAVNTVFQDYALFPHMSVGENVAYGLKVRGLGRPDRERAAREALALVRLEGYELRRPSQLSGGQRQRVALARALVLHPRVLLLDEPLGALDLKLREEMQVELKALQRRLGLTFVFVTHDQGEALSMADRVAVFAEGRLLQVGAPEEVYERPRTRFVADFVGSSNILPADMAGPLLGERREASLRPERIKLIADAAEAPAGWHVIEAKVIDVLYQGASRRVMAATETGLELAVSDAGHGPRPTPGSRCVLAFAPAALHPLEAA
ncbi:ABC transporter ATP-binding protein [Blastochloris sulfoviridis]|uniref:ABC transporter ATP-binding protein n=1 Tax=Blastochloris sulfoviridis TaxID=50712 RepID=UPI003CCC5630